MNQIQWFPIRNYSGASLTSTYLAGAGWKTVYVPETVQWGLVPASVQKHHVQHMRWIGIFTSWLGRLWSEHTKGQASIRQQAGHTVLSVVIVANTALTAFTAVAVPCILFTGSQTVVYQSPKQLQVLLYLESLSFFAALLSGFTRSRSGRSYGPISFDFEQVGLSPFQAATIIHVTISGLIGRKLVLFPPSYKSKPSNTPNWITLLIQKVDADLLANLLILWTHLAGGFVGLRVFFAASQEGNSLRYLFSQAGYPAFLLLWVKYVLQCGTKIPFMISSQPIWPLRESLLVRDPVSKVAYPSQEAIDPRRIDAAQTFTKLAVLYHCIVLASTWWIG